MISRQAIRVSRAIPAFVMTADDRQYRVQALDPPADVLSLGRVSSHDHPLGRSQRTALEQDRVGDGNLSDVMQVTSPMQREQMVGRQFHRHPHGDAERRQPLAMPGCMIVALLHGLGQRQKNRLRFLQPVHDRLVAQHAVNPRAEHLRMIRSGQKFIRSRADPRDLILHCGGGRQHEHGDQVPSLVTPDPLAECDAVGQKHVQEDQVDRRLGQDFQPCRRPARANDVMTIVLDQEAQRLPVGVQVVDHQDCLAPQRLGRRIAPRPTQARRRECRRRHRTVRLRRVQPPFHLHAEASPTVLISVTCGFATGFLLLFLSDRRIPLSGGL